MIDDSTKARAAVRLAAPRLLNTFSRAALGDAFVDVGLQLLLEESGPAALAEALIKVASGLVAEYTPGPVPSRTVAALGCDGETALQSLDETIAMMRLSGLSDGQVIDSLLAAAIHRAFAKFGPEMTACVLQRVINRCAESRGTAH